MKNILSKIAAFFLLLPSSVFAQAPATSNKTGLKNAFEVAEETASSSYNTSQNLESILGDIILVIISLVGAVFVIFIFYAGYLWMTASGNEQKVDKSVQILKQSIIGLIVVVGAYAIAYFIIQTFSGQLK